MFVLMVAFNIIQKSNRRRKIMITNERCETVIGRVIGFTNDGCRVRDEETGEVVFYYGNGMKGDRVQVSSKYIHPRTKRVTYVLETVLEYGDFVA